MRKHNNQNCGSKRIALAVAALVAVAAAAVHPAATVYATHWFELIGVMQDDSVTFTLEDEVQDVPDDMTVLHYEGHYYTSVRFVAEMLGGEVGYDADTQTITVDYERPEPVYETVEVQTEQDAYFELPLRYVDANFAVTATYATINDGAELYFTLDKAPDRFVTTIDYDNAYFERPDGEQRPVDKNSFHYNSSSLVLGQEKVIAFVADDETVKQGTFVLPIHSVSDVTGDVLTVNLVLRVDRS